MYRQPIAQVDLKNRRHRRTQIIRPRKIRVMTVMLAQLDQAMDKWLKEAKWELMLHWQIRHQVVAQVTWCWPHSRPVLHLIHPHLNHLWFKRLKGLILFKWLQYFTRFRKILGCPFSHCEPIKIVLSASSKLLLHNANNCHAPNSPLLVPVL